MYHSRSSRLNWSRAKTGSSRANGTMWNARSQAANQGYSHLSGMESTSRQKTCGQSELRPASAAPAAAACRDRRPASPEPHSHRTACSRAGRHKRLASDRAIVALESRQYGRVELVGLGPAGGHDLGKCIRHTPCAVAMRHTECAGYIVRIQPHSHGNIPAGRDIQHVASGCLCADVSRIDCRGFAVDHAAMKGVFQERFQVLGVEQQPIVGHVLGEEPRELCAVGCRFGCEAEAFQRGVLGRKPCRRPPA